MWALARRSTGQGAVSTTAHWTNTGVHRRERPRQLPGHGTYLLSVVGWPSAGSRVEERGNVG